MPTNNNRKEKKPLYTGECEKGVWILQEELSLPFTPLIRTLDPSGPFAERPHMFFENYVYFSANSGQTVRPFRNKRCSYSDVTVHLF